MFVNDVCSQGVYDETGSEQYERFLRINNAYYKIMTTKMKPNLSLRFQEAFSFILPTSNINSC